MDGIVSGYINRPWINVASICHDDVNISVYPDRSDAFTIILQINNWEGKKKKEGGTKQNKKEEGFLLSILRKDQWKGGKWEMAGCLHLERFRLMSADCETTQCFSYILGMVT